MFGRKKLKKAIEIGLERGALGEALKDLGPLRVRSRAEADAIVWGLSRLLESSMPLDELQDAAYQLAVLFQDVDGRDCPAFPRLLDAGIPKLLALYQRLLDSPEPDESSLLFLLKMFALYGSREGAQRVVDAARLPLFPEEFMWSVVLGLFNKEHPHHELVFRSLSASLPPGYVGVSLLDAANAALVSGASFPHPFECTAGRARLTTWLTSEDPDDDSYALSATAALPFINESARSALLDLALGHRDTGVRIEAAWAAAKVGLKSGLEQLTFLARNYRHGRRAIQYLTELGESDRVPAECRGSEFQALAEFTDWLAHPNELGRVPDELEIVEHREISWPPTHEKSHFYLIKYRVRDSTGLGDDDTDCGLVGSTTFCLFSWETAQRPPEDVYALHCYWELESEGLIVEVEPEDVDLPRLVRKARADGIELGEAVAAAKMAAKLRYPQDTVALLSGVKDETEDGWLVLDGPRSRWYSRSEMPAGVPDAVVLEVHVGRYLLGFDDEPERARYLHVPCRKAPAEITTNYERLLSDAKAMPPRQRKEALNNFGPVGDHLDAYAAALIESGRAEEMRPVLDLLEPIWAHNWGYGHLGRVAFRCGAEDAAERLLVKLQQSYPDHHRSQEMGLLAELRCSQGRVDEALELLLGCLSRVAEEAKSASGSDIDSFEGWFQGHRGKLLSLFPEDGEAILSRNGVPETTLR